MVETNTPVLTLVIKSIESEGVTKLEEEVQGLVGTLSMLCSFLSVKDFCSFIFSKKFKQLTMQELEVIFEVGIYSRHEVTLQLSASVEPIFAVIGAAIVITVYPILPYALAFAAGAMIFIVVEEVSPESQSGGNADIATMGLIAGFIVMMCLDVALG